MSSVIFTYAMYVYCILLSMFEINIKEKCSRELSTVVFDLYFRRKTLQLQVSDMRIYNQHQLAFLRESFFLSFLY